MSYATRLLPIIAVLVGLVWAGAASRAQELSLQVGDTAPDFRCRDDRGGIWSLREHVGVQLVVVYFYPSDFSFCGTRQALRYRDAYRDLVKQGVEVVGVSGDAVAAHQTFKSVHALPFTLLADEDGSVARQFGVPLRRGGKAMATDAGGSAILGEDGRPVRIPRSVTAARWTFIVGKDGQIIYRDTGVSPVKDSQVVLEFIRGLGSDSRQDGVKGPEAK